MREPHLIKAKDDVPDAHPDIALHDERRVEIHVEARAHDEEEHRAHGAAVWQLAAEKEPVQDADDH
eukprot:1772679-Prymnesium_polylepis.1